MSSLIGAQSVYNQLGWGTNEMLGYSNPCLLANGDFLLIADSYLGSNGDKTTENFGMNDLWITRFNSTNEVLWQKSFGGSLDDDRGTVKELTNGDLIVTSRSNSQISGNKTVDSKGGFDFWVFRTDSNGNILWQKSFGTSGTEVPVDVVIVSDSMFCIVGNSNYQGIEADKTENSSGNVDFWIVMIDGNGNKIWDKTIGGTAGDEASKGIWDAENERIYIAGNSMSGIGGLKTEVNYGIQDIWMFSLDLSGNLINQKTIGGSNYDAIIDMKFDNQNNILIASNSDSDISGTKTQNSFGEFDGWLIKLNPNLEILGDYSFGGAERDNLNSILVRNSGEIVLGLASSSDNTGNRTAPLKGTFDCWFVGLNSTTMEIEWENSIGGSLIDGPIAIWEKDNSYKVVATSNSPISIDKTVSNWGETDFWAYEFSKTVGLEEFSKDMIVYPNPCQNYLYINSVNFEFNSYKILDLNGRTLLQGNKSSTTKIEVSALTQGVYFLKLLNNHGNEVLQKFIKG